MKNKILLCGLIIVIMAVTIALGYTNARYYSTASMTGDLDYVKTIGKISIYHPEWVGGYEGPNDGSGVFKVPEIPRNYANIHYEVTNKVNDKINEEEIEYYIRIIAEDGSNDIPIEYDVHEYNNPNKVLNLEVGVGYGPFILSANSEVTQQYSIKANWTGTDIKYLDNVQYLKVQMIKKRIDGTLKVIDETPLNMEYSGPKVKITFSYYLYGTSVPIGTSQTLNIEDNITIDFKDSAGIANLGINLPDEYIFHDVRHNINGANEYSGQATSVVIPEGACTSGYYVEVYLTSSTDVAVQLAYYNYKDYTTDKDGNQTYKEISDTIQTLIIPRGITIDFTNKTQIDELKIHLPIGYTLKGLDGKLINNKYTDTSITIPNTIIDEVHYIDVYMIPAETVTVKLSYYDSQVSLTSLIDTKILSNVPRGTVIDFKDLNLLSSLDIKLPDDYEFNTAYCNELDNTGVGYNNFTIPYSGENQTYNIEVVLNKVLTTITVPVKFYKNGDASFLKTATVTMNSNGTYEFNTSECRKLCPELENMSSFTIYIGNQWGNPSAAIGNTYENGTVIVDYNENYGESFELNNPDSKAYIYIKAWW